MSEQNFRQLLQDCFSDDVRVVSWESRPADVMRDPSASPFYPGPTLYDITIKCRSVKSPDVPDIFDNNEFCCLLEHQVSMQHIPASPPSYGSFEDGNPFMPRSFSYDVECDTKYVIRVKDPEGFVTYIEKATAKKRYDRQFDKDLRNTIGE